MQTKSLIFALLAATSASAAAITGRQNNNNNNNGAAAADANGAADFGQCTPTMSFELGRPGRKADEGTFLPTDPLVAEGQQDALNPRYVASTSNVLSVFKRSVGLTSPALTSIIMNRICDQLTNVCDANDAAVSACEAAQASTEALGTKDATTADAFNAALGF
ncbi:uncharacterized protein F4807DRAFT_104975 [Annulohypoxylon truncatum]|uniref:uncharacterized protein n=1 Tax=Annulohypoxylon truncatum TaxID=327061 RepID=UPI002008E78F|nr:uncharacterized protein F4807DRAFT_104975 [Annulohypoxylon truncatum]KAI1208949.1 hypothetical protein F4807DRAFT_104975 [Annulohypoxylon truncatum]